MRTLWTMMATSASTMCIGIPAGVYFRSPYTNDSYSAWQVYPSGDVNVSVSFIVGGSCGRNRMSSSPRTDYTNHAHSLNIDGDVYYDHVTWRSCGRNRILTLSERRLRQHCVLCVLGWWHRRLGFRRFQRAV